MCEAAGILVQVCVCVYVCSAAKQQHAVSLPLLGQTLQMQQIYQVTNVIVGLAGLGHVRKLGRAGDGFGKGSGRG